MIVAILRYLVPLEKIDAHLVAHREFLDTLYAQGHLIASGPQIPRTGGVIISTLKDRKTFLNIFAADPYMQFGLAEYQIYEFDAVKSILNAN